MRRRGWVMVVAVALLAASLGCGSADPEKARAACKAAETAWAAGKIEQARTKVAEALSAADSYWGARLLAGALAMASGDKKTALDAFDEVVENEPDWGLALAARGEVYRALGKMNRARADEDRAGALDGQLIGVTQVHRLIGRARKVCDRGL